MQGPVERASLPVFALRLALPSARLPRLPRTCPTARLGSRPQPIESSFRLHRASSRRPALVVNGVYVPKRLSSVSRPLRLSLVEQFFGH